MKRAAAARAELARLRRRIDQLDASLLRLLEQRVAAGQAVGATKRALGHPPYDPGRERGVRTRLARLAAPGLPADAVGDIYREIISLTRAQSAVTSVAFMGATGGLGHWAAVQRFGRASRYIACPTAEDLLRAVESGAAGYGVVSLEGDADLASLDTFDLLLDGSAQIFGEFRARGALLVLGRGRAAPRRLVAPAGLLAEHERWLRARFPQAQLTSVPSLAEAARRARAARVACLGTPLQAQPPLRVLGAVGGANARHARRFLVLSLARPSRSGRDKTILLFALPNRPGGLVRVLEPFARHRVNLLWIESRTSRGRPWAHLFLLEIEGHAVDRRVAKALEGARARTDYLKVLGSFPAEV